jgi:hypothetical protein
MLQAISSAQQGLQSSEVQVDRAAAQISAWPSAGQFAATGSSGPPAVDRVDLSSAAVSLSQATDAHAADTRVIHVVDDMQKQTLNMVG